MDATTGDLLITLPAQTDGTTALTPTTLVERAPLAWQERDGIQTAVAVAYAVDADGTVGFVLGSYDATLPLIIDPEVTYQTRGIPAWGYGGAVAVGADGTTYVVTSPIRSGTFGDLYVQAFAPDTEVPTEAAYFGGDDFDIGYAITVGADGTVAVVGRTRSPSFAAAALPGLPTTSDSDAFMLLLAPAGDGYTVAASDSLGDALNDAASDVAFDAHGNLYVSGMLNNGGGGESGERSSGYGFLARYNAAGVRGTMQSWGDDATEDRDAVTAADALAVTPNGHVFVVSKSSTYDWDVGTSTYAAELRGWNADGNATGVSTLSTSEYEAGGDIVADSGGNLYVVLSGETPSVLRFLAGQTSASTTIPLEPGNLQLAVDGNDDVVVLGGGFDSGGYLAKIAGVQIETEIPPPLAPEPPRHTVSYYQQTVDPVVTNQQGCDARLRGEQGIVILDYGAPRVTGSTPISEYGTQLIQNLDSLFDVADFVSLVEIEQAVQAFADGYYRVRSCPQYDHTNPDSIDPTPPNLVIALGISNGPTRVDSTTDAALTFNHGAAWAGMILRLNIYADQQNYNGVLIDGAYDAEVAWADQFTGRDATLNWARGFASRDVIFVNGLPQELGLRYYNFGSMDGAPRTDSWIQQGQNATFEFVYELSRGIPVARPLPQIYNAAYAKEWYHLSYYSFTRKGTSLQIAGVLTECATSGCATRSAVL